MKKVNRILSLVMALALAVSSMSVLAVCASASAPYEGTDERIIGNVVYQKYTGSKGTYYSAVNLCHSVEEAEKMTEINIVDEIDGVPVKTIDSQNYGETKVATIEKVTVADSVVDIGVRAFKRFPNLKSVALSQNLKSLGAEAFYGLSFLESVTIPAGVTEIGDATFLNCTALKKVVLKGDVKKIGRYAFDGCKNLSYISKCTKVISLGYGAFRNCSKLKSFYFPENIYISGHVFEGTGLTSVTLPATVRFSVVYSGAFYNCKTLKKVVFNDGKTDLVIEQGCFKGCTALKKVVLPRSAKSILVSSNAFSGCTALETVENSGRITGILTGAFENCKSLESIKFSSKIKKIMKKAFKGCSKLKSVTFKSTKTIPGSTYNYGTNIGNEKFDKDTFSGTPSGIRFYVKNATVAKKLQTGLKGSGVKSARIYRLSDNSLYYKNVK